MMKNGVHHLITHFGTPMSIMRSATKDIMDGAERHSVSAPAVGEQLYKQPFASKI
ncbi:hypothetical protein OH492_15905 [Vibrio chagasii]|nr:hypothetical protein [Vibrio chagasii]